MKKMIGSLLCLQLIVIGIMISMTLNIHNFDQLLFAGTTDVHLIFGETDEGLDHMMALVEEHGLLMTRMIGLDYENLILYATDVRFNGDVRLSEGRFPEMGQDEFISNIIQDDEAQVGVVANLSPLFNITIRPMSDIRYFHVDGRYRIHTTDVALLFEIEAAMSAYTHSFRIYAPLEDDRTILEALTMGLFAMPTVMTTFIIAAIPIVTFLCVGATLVQFSMSKAKESFTLHVHGFSQHKIVLKVLKSLLKTMILSGIVASLMLYGYFIMVDLLTFHLQIMFVFLLVFGLILLTYLVMSAVVMYLIFQLFSTHTAIKGYKPDFAIQILNHALKVIFMCLFLTGSYFVIMGLTNLSTQRNHLQNWEIARHVHRLYLSTFHPIEIEEFEQDVHDLERLRLALSDAHHGFIMHAENFFAYDLFPHLWEGRSAHMPPFEIAPEGNRVDVSLNFFQLNAIYTIEGLRVEEQLVWDDLVMNILVPDFLRPYEALIQEAYLAEFYFASLNWQHRDAEMEETEVLPYTIDDLSVNIIYVENDQYYFTFDTRIRPKDGNRIKDPIAVVHTGNFHPMYMMRVMGSGFYFMSDSENPFDEISDMIASYGLAYPVRFHFPVFSENIEAIRLIEQDIISGILSLIALIITNFIVNYNLISNYFWRNKHTLFTKSLFGFSLSKRHKWFILSFLIYVIPINIIMAFFFGWPILVLGVMFLILDVILAFIFEKSLMRKSFSEIMKGEH
ncbi:MAG: DUF1430 domain-containing protein [Defluviitaleaceae bacterium]|nr:DUF1430 domain-containing protein [Defluviitaleaceae bacterium]